MNQRHSTLVPRFDSLEQEVFLGLWRTYDRLRMLEDELFAQFDLTPQQYNVLRLLESHQPEGLKTLQLASRLVSRAPDITRMLDKLETRGLIERERRTENRRVVEVRISQAGSALVNDIAEPLKDCHARQLGHMSPAELKRLAALLQTARKPHELATSYWK
ncbi:MAG: MarR family winged helix-turn-helix transcriptional regulator [Planctomycetaceae bacterium]